MQSNRCRVRGGRRPVVVLGLVLALAACSGDEADRAAPAAAAGPASGVRKALAVRTPDSGALFDWAERTFPQFFPSHQVNASFPPYTYRYYPETGNYVGVNGSEVVVLGPISGGAILTVGQVADFACQVYPADCAPPPITSYAFTALPSTMTVARAMHTATLLRDGKVLIAGGFSASTFPGAALNTAELFDPATRTFTALPSRMRSGRTSHAAVLLPDGKVLITGGQANTNDGDGVATAELYDPATQAFTSLAAAMKSPRGEHTATLLPDGKVLLAGGYYQEFGTLKFDAELYDPATQTFTASSAKMVLLRDGHRATLLTNGKVLITGGTTKDSVYCDSPEVYDPATQSFAPAAGRMTVFRGLHDTALLPGGLVLLSGGAPVFSPTSLVVLQTAEVFDPVAQAFSPIAATMTTTRAGHRSTLLADGSVLLTGGVHETAGRFTVLSSAELFKAAGD